MRRDRTIQAVESPASKSLGRYFSRFDQLKREQRFEPCPYFVEYAGWSLADEPRSSLLPGGAAQLICLHGAADHVALRYRDVKAPLTIAPRYRASYAAARQLIEGAWRKHERWAPSGLLIGDRLQEVEPNNISRFGAIGRHLTMPHCRVASPNRPPPERCPWSFRSTIPRACSAAYAAA